MFFRSCAGPVARSAPENIWVPGRINAPAQIIFGRCPASRHPRSEATITQTKTTPVEAVMFLYNLSGGRGEIRTLGERKPTTVFKTVTLNHSVTLP